MISRLVKQLLDVWLRLSSSRARSCALTQSSPARAPRPSEVSDPIVTIDTSKIILALEEGSKKTALKVLSVCRCETGFHHSRVGNSVLNHQVR